MTINYIFIASFGECKARMEILANSPTVGTVLLAYDSLLTLFEEVSYIWKKKWKLGTVLYLLTRYALLVFTLIETILSLNFTSLQVCFFHDFH